MDWRRDYGEKGSISTDAAEVLPQATEMNFVKSVRYDKRGVRTQCSTGVTTHVPQHFNSVLQMFFSDLIL